jgi:hypothetical protein
MNGVDPEQESDWSRQHEWLATHLDDLHRVFAKGISGLDLEIEASVLERLH